MDDHNELLQTCNTSSFKCIYGLYAGKTLGEGGMWESGSGFTVA